MDPAEIDYHAKLAAEIAETTAGVRRGEQSLVLLRYREGKRLNDVYPGEPIPFLDREQIMEIYGCKWSTVTWARRLASNIRDEAHAIRIADEYGNWTGVIQGFLRGLTSGQTKRVIENERRQQKTRRHLANIPDSTRNALMDNGLPEDEARDAVKFYIYTTDPNAILAVWKRRKELQAWRTFRGR